MKSKNILALSLCFFLVLTACTAAEIDSYITLAAQLAGNALSLVSSFQGKAIAGSDLAAISEWSQLLQKTVADVQTNRTKGTTALIAVLQAAENNLPAYLQNAHIQDPTLRNRIEQGTTAFLTVIESIAAFYPKQAARSQAPHAIRMSNASVYTLPPRVKVPISQIREQWNAGVCGDVTACLAH